MYASIIIQLPALNLNELFKMTSEAHHHKTRSTSNQCFYVKNIKDESMRRSFAFMNTKVWNSLPIAIKILNKSQFKTEIRNIYFI